VILSPEIRERKIVKVAVNIGENTLCCSSSSIIVDCIQRQRRRENKWKRRRERERERERIADGNLTVLSKREIELEKKERRDEIKLKAQPTLSHGLYEETSW